MNILNNARQPRESFKNYRARLKVVAKVVKSKLRGELVHVSSRVAVMPDPLTPEILEAISKGQLVRMDRVVAKDGKLVHLMREKGTTFVRDGKDGRPGPKPPSARDLRRALVAA